MRVRAVIALALLALVAGSASGVQRLVVVENFTNSG